MNSRAIATKILVKVLVEKMSLTKALNETITSVPETSQGLVKEIVFGVCRYYFTLKAIAHVLLNKPLRKNDQSIHILLMVGLYQLIYLRTPDHAAVAETVEAAKALKKNWGCAVLNASLRRFLRESKAILKEVNTSEVAKYAHPAWLIRSIKAHWGQQWRDILTTNNSQAPLTLRVNTQKVPRETYLKKLEEHGVAATALAENDQAIQLKSAVNVQHLPGFMEGLVSVQDLSSQMLNKLIPENHQRILDACAAPGGKSCLILENNPELDLTAVDIGKLRVQKIEENLNRLGLNAHVINQNVAHITKWWDDKPFDTVMLDAPCSSTGVIRRHPDIKILRHSRDINKLAEQQLHLLHTVWPLLKDKGQLIYSTCSILPEENDEVIATFIARQKDATVIPFTLPIGEKSKQGWQCIPKLEAYDGFYYSCLTKTA